MDNESKQAGRAENVDCLYDIAELFVLVSNRCDTRTGREIIRVFQSEGFGVQNFRAKIKKVVDCTTLGSSKMIQILVNPKRFVPN